MLRMLRMLLLVSSYCKKFSYHLREGHKEMCVCVCVMITYINTYVCEAAYAGLSITTSGIATKEQFSMSNDVGALTRGAG